MERRNSLIVALTLHVTISPFVMALAATGVSLQQRFDAAAYFTAVVGTLLFFWPPLLVSAAVQAAAFDAIRSGQVRRLAVQVPAILTLPLLVDVRIASPGLRLVIQNGDDFFVAGLCAALLCFTVGIMMCAQKELIEGWERFLGITREKGLRFTR